MAKRGRPRRIQTPEELWDHYQGYRLDILMNPVKVPKWVGKDAVRVEDVHFEPPTWRGFEAYLFEAGIASDLERYRRNLDDAYRDFIDIIRTIGAAMFRRKFTGAAIGIYNQNIIARELGLADAQEVTNFERPILEGGKELPKDK